MVELDPPSSIRERLVFHHHRSCLPIIVVDFSYKVKLNGGMYCTN